MPTPGLNYNHLYYFHVVANEGSIAAAAKHLNITQPTISEQLSKLEQALDHKLFDRSSGRLRLNLAGRRAYEHTSLMFRTSSRLLQYFKNNLDQDELVLEIGIAASVSRTFAADYFLPLFQKSNVRVRIRQGDCDDLLHAVLSRELDVLLSDNHPIRPDTKRMRIRPVYRPKMIAVAAEGLAAQIRSFPTDLGNHPYIAYVQNSRYRWELDHYFSSRGLRPKITAEIDDVNLMRICAENGLAFAILPAPVVAGSIESEALTVLGEVSDIDTTIYAHFHSEEIPEMVSNAVQLLTHTSVSHPVGADGDGAHADGDGARADGDGAHADGDGARADGDGAHADGDGRDAIFDGAGADGAGTDGAGADGAGTDGAGTDGAGTDGAVRR